MIKTKTKNIAYNNIHFILLVCIVVIKFQIRAHFRWLNVVHLYSREGRYFDGAYLIIVSLGWARTPVGCSIESLRCMLNRNLYKI